MGLPHHVNTDTIEKVAATADAELGALVLHGASGFNTGAPLTVNQKARQQQIKEAEKKRAAAAKEKLNPPSPPPPTIDDAAKAAHVRTSAATSMWAKPCALWAIQGSCTKAISCPFVHAGFPVEEKRCITC